MPKIITTRKIARNRAHANMKRRGIQHINKRSYSLVYSPFGAIPTIEPSFFAKNWRDYSAPADIKPRRERKTV